MAIFCDFCFVFVSENKCDDDDDAKNVQSQQLDHADHQAVNAGLLVRQQSCT